MNNALKVLHICWSNVDCALHKSQLFNWTVSPLLSIKSILLCSAFLCIYGRYFRSGMNYWLHFRVYVHVYIVQFSSFLCCRWKCACDRYTHSHRVRVHARNVSVWIHTPLKIIIWMFFSPVVLFWFINKHALDVWRKNLSLWWHTKAYVHIY